MLRTSSRSSLHPLCALIAGLALLGTPPLFAQEHGVVSSEIAVSSREAALDLELQGGRRLEITFRDGQVRIDGEPAGTYTAGDALDRSWRELLGRAVSLDNGPLAEALVAWAPPADLPAAATELAARLDTALEAAATAQAANLPAVTPTGGVTLEGGDALRRLLRDAARLPGLAAALEELELDRLRLYDDDVTIPADEVVESTVVIVDGDLDVYGTVRSDVLAIDGNVRLHEGARIEGDVRLVDGQLDRQGGQLLGSVRDIEADVERVVRESEVERRIEEAVRRSAGRRDAFSPFRYIGEGIAGIIHALAMFAVFALLGSGVVFFARDKLETVADTARHVTGRAAGVGLAGLFLLVPAFILGIIVLVVSLVGIPLLLVWIPLFPLAAFAACVLGYLGVAHGIGEYVASHRFEGLEWLRRSNSYYYMLTGLGALLAAFVAAQAVSIGGPWFGVLKGLLIALGVFATMAAVVIGLGAVILSRGGTSREFVGRDAAGLSDMEPGLADVESSNA
ncbi:MAG: hypothetical protein HY701_01050 [Gemmatimonadetes bacterium]|nr:hypothetical protein [Gemmatimonadota bacterium]